MKALCVIGKRGHILKPAVFDVGKVLYYFFERWWQWTLSVMHHHFFFSLSGMNFHNYNSTWNAWKIHGSEDQHFLLFTWHGFSFNFTFLKLSAYEHFQRVSWFLIWCISLMTSIYITEWQKKNASIQTNSKWMYYKHEYCTLYFGMRICVEVYIHWLCAKKIWY